MAIEFESFANDVIDIHVRDGGAAGGGGKVQTVNHKAPDEDGNVNVVAWEEGTSETVRIYFDGTLEGKEYVVNPGLDGVPPVYMIKIADYRDGMNDPALWRGRESIEPDTDGNLINWPIESIEEIPLTETVTGLWISAPPLSILPETVTIPVPLPDGSTVERTYSKGVWVSLFEEEIGNYHFEITPSLEYPAEIHKLEPKFLPDGNGWYETVPKRRLVFSGKVEDYEHHWFGDHSVRVKISDDITGLALPYGFDPKDSNDYDYMQGNGPMAPGAVGRVWEQMRFAGYDWGEYYGLDTERYKVGMYETAEAPLYTLLESDRTTLISIVQYPTPDPGDVFHEGPVYSPGIWLHLYYEYGYSEGSTPTYGITTVEIPEGRIYHEVDSGILPKGIGQDVRQEEPVEIVYNGDPESHEYIVMEQEESEGYCSYTYLVKISDTPYKAEIFNLGIMEMAGRQVREDENGDALLEELSMPYWIKEAMDTPGLGFGIIIEEPGLFVLSVEDPELIAAILDATSGGEAGEALSNLTPGMWAMQIGERAVDEDGNVLYEMAVWVEKMISKPQPSLWIKPVPSKYIPERAQNPFYVTTLLPGTEVGVAYCMDEYERLQMVYESGMEYYALLGEPPYKGLQLSVEGLILDMYQYDVFDTREYDGKSLRYISFRRIMDAGFFGDMPEEMGIDPGALVWIEAKVWQDRIVEVQVIPIEIGGGGVEGTFIPGETLTLDDNGVLNVKTTDVAEENNTLPITSAGVNTIVGNIGAILDTI